jgi:polysaccharide export outer membrane protein
MILGLVAGCASSGVSTQQEKAIAQVKSQMQGEPQSKKNSLQYRLLTQGTLSGPKSSQDYQVGPEDLLAVQFLNPAELNREVRVNNQGEISLPLVGSVKVAGLTPQQIERSLMELYQPRYLINPQISVFVKEYRHQRVAVTGAVGKPGTYEMLGPHRLLEVLAMAGGLSETSSDKIHLIRYRSSSGPSKNVGPSSAAQSFNPNAETIVIDLRRLLMEGVLELNYPIHQGDVVHVPFAGFAYVIGEVREPGKVPVKQDLTVTQAIALAKGPTEIAAQTRITILRLDEQGQRLSLDVDLDQVTSGARTDIPIKENDIVVVPDHMGKRTWRVIKEMFRGSLGLGLRPY